MAGISCKNIGLSATFLSRISMRLHTDKQKFRYLLLSLTGSILLTIRKNTPLLTLLGGVMSLSRLVGFAEHRDSTSIVHTQTGRGSRLRKDAPRHENPSVITTTYGMGLFVLHPGGMAIGERLLLGWIF